MYPRVKVVKKGSAPGSIVNADVTDPNSVAKAAKEVGELTGGSLDVLINNACNSWLPCKFYPTFPFLGKEEELKEEIETSASHDAAVLELGVNVLGTMYCINQFLPLIRGGEQKKIIYITSPEGDIGFTRQVGSASTLGYSMTKAGMMLVMAKYAAELGVEGIKTLSLGPAWVDSDLTRGLLASPEIMEIALKIMQKVKPDIKGMMSPEESVEMQLNVIDKLSMKQSGMVLSHHGTVLSNHGDSNWL